MRHNNVAQAQKSPEAAGSDSFPYNPAHEVGTCAKCGRELSPPSCSVDLIERIAKDSFHSPFVGPYTSELRRVLNAPTGSVHDTMIRDLYRRLARLYSSANPAADLRRKENDGHEEKHG